MKKLYCVTCGTYRKFEKVQNIIHMLGKTLVLFIICSKYKKKMGKYLKKKNQLRY